MPNSKLNIAAISRISPTAMLVTDNGFEYKGLEYGSLSKIANVITGTRWNGLVFFGLKKKDQEVAVS